MAWEKVPETIDVVPGATYRLGFQIKAPYSYDLAKKITDAVQTGAYLRYLLPFDQLHESIQIRRIFTVQPSVANRTGRNEPWWFFVEFMKRKGNPVLPIIFGLIALIIVASAAVLISGRSFERFFTVTGTEISNTLDKVLNPGVILGAFVLGFLALSRR